MGLAFARSTEVEREAWARLRPWITSSVAQHSLVMDHYEWDVHREAKVVVGYDFGYFYGGRFRRGELKAERKTTGNLFLEAWSNHPRGMYANVGWMVTCKADKIWYYFLDTDTLHVIDFPSLRSWAFGPADDPRSANVYRYRMASPIVEQANRTTGYVVPVADLRAALKGWDQFATFRRLGDADFRPELTVLT
jgi:hypothetical protein